MKLNSRLSALAALLVLLLPVAGCNRLKSRDQLNKGIAAFKNGNYEQAINHFQTSVDLDPDYPAGKLYLATAYAYQVVPNDTTPANLKLANKAIDGFNQVLAKDPKDKTALQQIASIYRNTKEDAKAKEYELKVIEVDPTDAEAHYTIGFVDWRASYQNALEALAKDGIKDNGDGNPKMSKATCATIKAQNTDLVNDGLTHLNKAVEINPTYDDAMQYLNLVYRRQADFACGNPEGIKASISQAEEWSKKAMGARQINEQKKEEKAAHGGVVAGK